MVADRQKQILGLAGALIAAAALAGCGDSVDIKYDESDRGLKLKPPKRATREKCYGIALAQHNDCAAGPNSDCAGTATRDNLLDRWAYVPLGTCADAGGSLIPGAPLPDENA